MFLIIFGQDVTLNITVRSAESISMTENGYTFQRASFGTTYKLIAISNDVTGDVVIPATFNNLNVGSFGEGVFANRDDITSIIFTGTTSLLSNKFTRFDNCPNLASVTFENGVGSISFGNLIQNCPNLTSITIKGDRVPEIRNIELALEECGNVTFYVPQDMLDSYLLSGWSSLNVQAIPVVENNNNDNDTIGGED